MLVKLPKIGLTMTKGRIIKWFVKEGDFVRSGDVLCEFETDKASSKIESEEDGYILHINVHTGEEVKVFEPVCEVGAKMQKKEPGKEPAETSCPETKVQMEHKPSVSVPGKEQKERRFISPLAKKIAVEKGLDINKIPYCGRRISKCDVLSYMDGENEKEAYRERGHESETGTPLCGMRAVIAARMSDSKREIPHVYFKVEADASEILRIRALFRERTGEKISVTAFLIKALAKGIQRFPMFHAKFIDGLLYQQNGVNICVAMEVPDGLVTPCICDADHKSLGEIAGEIKELSEKAKNHTLSVKEITEGAFTITNLGHKNIDEFQAIINYPQVAILSAGSVREKAVVKDGEVAVRAMVNLVLSVDHRVIDGSLAADFLAEVKKYAEDPAFMLL